ncbi:MAG: GOLPH3/VPS74 family protein [Beutenbergiaceae bacterium]
MNMLIAEDLTLLLLDDHSGVLKSSAVIVPLLGGALLVDLTLSGQVAVEDKPKGLFKTAKVLVTGSEPASDPLLRQAMATISSKPRGASDLVMRLGRGVKQPVITRLVERGLITQSRESILGIFTATRWPATPEGGSTAGYEGEVRRSLVAMLAGQRAPDPRGAAVVGLLTATDAVHRVLPVPGLSNREVKARAKKISEGNWATKAVRDVIVATSAAASAAAVAAASAGS